MLNSPVCPTIFLTIGSPKPMPQLSCRFPKRPSSGLPPKATFAVLRASAPASAHFPSTIPTTYRRSRIRRFPASRSFPRRKHRSGPRSFPALTCCLHSCKPLFPSDLPLRDKLFLTIKEAARFAGLPQATIRRLIHAGKIPAVKAGGWRIKRSELEKLDLGHLVDLSDKPVLNTQNKGVRR